MKTTMFTKALVAGLAAGSVVFGEAPPADAAPAPGLISGPRRGHWTECYSRSRALQR